MKISKASLVEDYFGEGTRFGRYALLQKIGVGGMAEIYRAKTFGAAGFEKEFAIKLILPSLVDDDEFVEMFINEAKIAVSLYHANVVQVFDLGEIDGQYYIAMEYVRGKDLLEVLARCAERNLKIPLDLVLFIAMEMLKGLSFAHRASDPYGEDLNIIHRDVSPSNILISYAGDVKVGDFGVAKAAIQRTLTESGTLKGKVGYMSPEQVMGQEIDARSDVFAAGVVFFEALSMSRLFVGNSDLEVMLQVRDAAIDSRVQKALPLPSGLLEIVRKALARHKEERYQTSAEFYEALVDFSYRQGIKVTGSDLSNFMRRLFADEIEREKALRRAEPRAVRDVVRGARVLSGRVRNARRAGLSRNAPHILDDMPISEAQDSEEIPPERSNPHPADLGQDFYDAEALKSSGMSHVELPADDADERPLAAGPADDDTIRAPLQLDTIRVVKPDLHEQVMESTVDESSLGGANTSDDPRAPEDSSRLIPNTIPFEISSSAFDLGGAPEENPAAPAEPRRMNDLEDTTTAEFYRGSESFANGVLGHYASYEGALERVSFARILARLHQSSATGRLFVQSGAIEKSIYLRKGEPILIDTNKEAERFGAFVLRQRRITEGQLSDALERLDEWGGRLGDALVAVGAIEAHEIFELLFEQMLEKLLDVFMWRSGRYGYYENQEPHTMGYPLGLDTYSTIVKACRREIPLEMIKAFYSGREHVSIFRPQRVPVDVDRLKLSARELRVLTELVPGTSLRSLLNQVEPERRELVQRTIYLLHQVEILKLETTDRVDLPEPHLA